MAEYLLLRLQPDSFAVPCPCGIGVQCIHDPYFGLELIVTVYSAGIIGTARILTLRLDSVSTWLDLDVTTTTY